MENMAEQCMQLNIHLKQEMKNTSNSEKKVIDIANRLKSKLEQYAYLEKQADRTVNMNRRKIQTFIASATSQAMERAEETKFVILSWGNGDADMKKTDFNADLLERVSKSEKLSYVARFLGKYKDIYSSKHNNGYEYGRGEKYDITTGSNFSKALTSEMSLLSDPNLIPVFIRKYQNKQLKQYRRRESICKGKGDIIVCLDESSSTYGDNQAWGMAVAMMLLHICRQNKRNFALIHFAKDIKTDLFRASDGHNSRRSQRFYGKISSIIRI